MSNPVLGPNVATQAFASVVVSLPETHGGRGKERITAGLEMLREETRAQAAKIGFTDGQASGFDAGYAEGLREGRAAAAEEARLVGEALAQEVGRLHERVETGWQEFLASSEAALTDRCLETVRELLNAELAIDRSSAVAIVRRCLGEVVHATSIRIRVAAEDLPNLQEYLRDDRVELVADASIGAGCVVESSSGSVDGTIGTALRLLETAWDEAA